LSTYGGQLGNAPLWGGVLQAVSPPVLGSSVDCWVVTLDLVLFRFWVITMSTLQGGDVVFICGLRGTSCTLCLLLSSVVLA
jgi:hypothetical protein